jgi:hypothetical protein
VASGDLTEAGYAIVFRKIIMAVVEDGITWSRGKGDTTELKWAKEMAS